VAEGKNDAIDSTGAATIAVSVAMKELVLDFNGAYGLCAH
jgi:hypothetical protein